MAGDTVSYLRRLKKRGYTVPGKDGQGHIQVWYGDTLVASTSGTGDRGRGFLNFKAQVRRFEQGKSTLKTRKRSRS